MLSIILITFLVLIGVKLFALSRAEKPETIKDPAESLICGYCLRETDVYMEPTLDNIIEKFLIPQGVGPQDAVVYAVYGDYKRRRITDFSKYTEPRTLAPKERKAIRQRLRAEFEELYPAAKKGKKKQERTDIFRAPTGPTGLYTTTGELHAYYAVSGVWIPSLQKPLTRAQQLKQFLDSREKERSLDWCASLYADAAKRQAIEPIEKRISNESGVKQECVRSKNQSHQVSIK